MSKAEIPRNMVVSDEEWEKMKSMISDQIDSVDSNLNELKDNGSLETIAHMIKRGDKIPSARLQAWYHGMLEVEYCNRPQLVSQKLQYMYRTHGANGPDEAPLSFVLDTTLTASSSANEEWKRRGGRPLESAESIVARLEGKKDLTVVERQELWLAKKNLKTETLKSIIAAQKLLERATTAPDLSQSRRTFRNLTNESKTPARKRSVASSGPDASSDQKIKRSRRLTSGPMSNR
ncbi:hypothetical protein ACHAW5_003157 [Stephanodiscus triporus]|uniref:Uncharacterized protein n=1 Tax=Stephanodiscus triporus TaxID=2934178 RepID=A0ABD3MW24_9STRA